MRIVSLIPSGTDIAISLGLGAHLVGVSHACDHPLARDLPIVTRSILDANLSPAQIDAQANQTVQSGQSLYLTNRALLDELEPDIVLTQAICDVCAVNEASARASLPRHAQLLSLDATDFAGLWRDMERVAGATQVHDRLQVLAGSLQGRLEAIEAKIKDVKRPRVLVLEWTNPPFLGGHWVPEIIARAGGVAVPDARHQPSRRATWNEIATFDADVILLAPCGYDLVQTREQGRALLGESRFGKLRAVQKKRVWATNATHLFSRCTPEIVRAVEVVAGILHPEICAPPQANEAQLLA